MPWFKVDDKLCDHRKARAAGPTAMGVWLLCGSWAAGNLTDGFIPLAILRRFGRQRDALKLVEVGLWLTAEQDGETGWRFHDWGEFQPTRAQKLAEREVRAEAGRVGGLRSGRSRREAKAKQVASDLVEPPTRPDPTRPTASDEAVQRLTSFAVSTAPESKPAPKGTRLPADWKPSDALAAQMRDECPGVDLHAEHRVFADYWSAQPGQKGVKTDWPATWRNWMRRAAKDRRPRSGPDWDASHARAVARDRAEGLL